MEKIVREATDETPKVILDVEAGEFEFSGKSLPEDVTQFFNPILDWFDNYGVSPSPETKVVFKMDYFNTASSKLILDILMKLEEINEEHGGIQIDWYFREDDEDMEEAGEEYADIVDVPFENISY